MAVNGWPADTDVRLDGPGPINDHNRAADQRRQRWRGISLGAGPPAERRLDLVERGPRFDISDEGQDGTRR